MQRFQDIRFVFLDRDGVINRKRPEGEYVESREDFHLLPGVEPAIATLNAGGRKVIVVTNQRGIALGRYGHAQVQAIHDHLQSLLAAHGAHIDAFYYCPHNRNECDCRKPGPGLFLQAFRDFPAANPTNSVIIGDSLSDIEAGHNLGMPAIFLEGPAEHQRSGDAQARDLADAVCSSLAEAVTMHLSATV